MSSFDQFINQLWNVSNEFRSRSVHRPSRSHIAGVLAAIVYLRWHSVQDENLLRSSAGYPDSHWTILPVSLRWANWRNLKGDELDDFISSDLPYSLLGLKETPQTAPLRNIGSVLQADMELPTFIYEAMIELVDGLDFDSEATSSQPKLMDELVGWTVGEGRGSAEHFTPQSVADLVVELINPKLGERIYDPCFGSASILVSCVRKLREGIRYQSFSPSNNDVQRFFGCEINPVSYVIGMTRLALEGVREQGLYLHDSLRIKDLSASDPFNAEVQGTFKEKFDVVVASPPWGSIPATSSSEFQKNFRFPSRNLETVFLQHIAECLRPGGRAAVILPEATLFRPGIDRDVRRWLLEDYRVDGVISLPGGALAPYTNIKSNVLLFRRQRPADSIRFCVLHGLVGAERRPSSDSKLPIDVAREFYQGEEGADIWDTPIKDVSLRNWELVAKPSGIEQIQRLFTAIQEADSTIAMTPLSAVADVISGLSYDRAGTTDKPSETAAAPGLVRVADVQEGKLIQPTLFLRHDTQRNLNNRLFLRPGDVVVSASGSIGKVAVVRSTGRPLIPSSSVAVVRPKEGVTPAYISSLLQSESYQRWLFGHARGATIQHLSVATLRNLPVPLPSLEKQHRLASALEGKRGEALSVLLEIITGNLRDPIATWLESGEPVRAILEPRLSMSVESSTIALDNLALSCRQLRNQVAHVDTKVPNSRLQPWILAFSAALDGLRGLSQIPDGASKLAVLEAARAEVVRASRILGEHSSLPEFTLAISLGRRVEDLVTELRERLIDSVTVQAKVEPEIVPAGTQAEVLLRVRKLSPLPLRNFSITTEPSVGKASLAFLADQELSVPLSISAPEKPGFYDFDAKWRGIRLDGSAVSGRISLRIQADQPSHLENEADAGDFGTSPYIVGNPIDRSEMLFGRDDVLEQIKRQLSTTQRANVILLEGNRRTGKTSVLQRLATPGELEGWLPVICSFQGGEGAEGAAGLHTREVFRLMAREIGWQLFDFGIQTWLPSVAMPSPLGMFKLSFANALSAAFNSSHPFELFELYLQSVIEACHPRRLLLMLDEFDKLQEGIDSGVTSSQVPENIRYLIHKYPDLSAILTGSRRLKRLREEYWSALFGFGHRIGISSLSLDAARLLVTRPVEGRLIYVDEARDRLVELCACHPFLIQSLCNRVFEDAARKRIRNVTVSFVESAAQDMVHDNEHFRTLWGYAGTDRRRLVLALIERLSAGPDPIGIRLLDTKLEELGIQIPTGERLGDDIEFLRELELIDIDSQSTGTAYGIAVPLLGRWIRNNVDFDDLCEKASRESQARLK